MKKQVFFIFILSVAFFSCKEQHYLKGKKDSSIQVHFRRFDQDFNALRTADISTQKAYLAQTYPDLYEIYNRGIIRVGAHSSPDYKERVLRFLNDSIYQIVYDTVQYHFQDLSSEEKKLTEAFQNYHLLFPQRQIPACYTHISGFNEPIVVGDSILSISLENYLGEEHQFYKNLGVYNYMLAKKNRQNLACDAMRGWLMAEFLNDDQPGKLLDRMIQEGKLLFILEVIMPDEAPYRLIGLRPEQYVWSQNNERQLWTFAIEHEHLYSTHQLTISKYFQDGPFFNFLGSGSSPLVGKYLGWQIVRSYMKNNKELSIQDLINTSNSQDILQHSGYKP